MALSLCSMNEKRRKIRMVKQSVKDLSREEWLKMRKEGLGGSDAGAVCGLNPYASQ